MAYRRLSDHLFPKGASELDPNTSPSVLDSDGAVVTFISGKRRTNEATAVNLGDGPNTNDGDPLRSAFAKINNFIEAVYWWDENVGQQLGFLSQYADSEFTLLKTYTVATLPSPLRAGGLIFVSDETGGAVTAFSDGTNWRRTTDRAIVS